MGGFPETWFYPIYLVIVERTKARRNKRIQIQCSSPKSLDSARQEACFKTMIQIQKIM